MDLKQIFQGFPRGSDLMRRTSKLQMTLYTVLLSTGGNDEFKMNRRINAAYGFCCCSGASSCRYPVFFESLFGGFDRFSSSSSQQQRVAYLVLFSGPPPPPPSPPPTSKKLLACQLAQLVRVPAYINRDRQLNPSRFFIYTFESMDYLVFPY